MRSLAAVALAVAVTGCSATYKPHPADHDPVYSENLPEAPAWKPLPIGAKPTLQQITNDCEAIVWTKGPACTEPAKAILYEGEAGVPPGVKNASPGLYQAHLTVERGVREYRGSALKVWDEQPTLEARAWINTGQGFKRHHLHYLDGKLVHVAVE